MELVEVAKLGSQVVLDAIVLWLVIKYLPNRDRMFMEEMKRHTRQLNRLVNAFILLLDDDDKKRQKMSDEIFKDESGGGGADRGVVYEEPDDP